MRQAIQNLEESKIREVANAGMGRSDVLAFWFGESDEVTPDFIRQAAIESLQSGETFYGHNLGLPALRDAVAQAGYQAALTCSRGTANTAANRYEIPRKAIAYGDDLFGFAQPHQAMIDEHASELIADRFVNQHGGHSRIDPA